LKHIIYENSHGLKQRALVKDTDGEREAEFGIPAGPPDVRNLDWETIQREVNLALVRAGLFTWLDVQQKGGLEAATNVLKRHLINAYREQAEPAETGLSTNGE
jgi:predicted nuclease with TOPRIM domain